MKTKNLVMALALIAGISVVHRAVEGRGGRVFAAPPQQAATGNSTRYLYMGQELTQPKSQAEIEWMRRRKAEEEKRAR